MSKTVYLLWGATGEYDDARDWVVCAHETEAGAEQHRDLAQARVNELISEMGWGRIPYGANEHDPLMQVDYTGVTYSVGSVDLRD